jgi:hypothetical protein
MKHITTEYGSETNKLELTFGELDALRPFLEKLGIRCRVTEFFGHDVTIQAENPYKSWIDDRQRKIADDEMSEDSIKAYAR